MLTWYPTLLHWCSQEAAMLHLTSVCHVQASAQENFVEKFVFFVKDIHVVNCIILVKSDMMIDGLWSG